jgi:hypothetical protein
MLVPDLSRILREADRDQLAAALLAAVDTAGYTPAPRPDCGGTDRSLARAEARAEPAREVVDAIVLALAAHPARPRPLVAPIPELPATSSSWELP